MNYFLTAEALRPQGVAEVQRSRREGGEELTGGLAEKTKSLSVILGSQGCRQLPAALRDVRP